MKALDRVRSMRVTPVGAVWLSAAAVAVSFVAVVVAIKGAK
jgi:hypothetical protein